MNKQNTPPIASPGSALVGIVLFILVIAVVVGAFGLAIYAAVAKNDRDASLRRTKENLQSIARTTIISKKGWEPVVSESITGVRTAPQEIVEDAWGTNIKLLYLKVPDMTIALTVSAGPDGLWETEDDLFGAAYSVDELAENPMQE